MLNNGKYLFFLCFLLNSQTIAAQAETSDPQRTVEIIASVDDDISRVDTRSYIKPLEAIKALINGEKISKELEDLLHNRQDRPTPPQPMKLYDDPLTPKSQI